MIGNWLRLRSDAQKAQFDMSAFHFKRPELTDRLRQILDGKAIALVYGLPRQGKSTLLKEALGANKQSGSRAQVGLRRRRLGIVMQPKAP